MDLGKIIKWDGQEGLIEDSQGEIIRFTYEDIHPRNLKDITIGTVVVITDSGYLELTSQTFSHYIDDSYEGRACNHDRIKNSICVDCGEVSNLED